MVQTNLVCSNDNIEWLYINCKFHDPLDRGSSARVLAGVGWQKGLGRKIIDNFDEY